MKSSTLLLLDAAINLAVGILLVTFSKFVVDLLGVPDANVAFYPSILGAVLIGIGVALVIEYFRRPAWPAGLGLYGAVAINLCGAFFLAGWLLVGRLDIPMRGLVFLWTVTAILIVTSLAELAGSRPRLQ